MSQALLYTRFQNWNGAVPGQGAHRALIARADEDKVARKDAAYQCSNDDGDYQCAGVFRLSD